MSHIIDQHTRRQREWFPIESIIEICGKSERWCRNLLKPPHILASQMRIEPNPNGTGRPHIIYHYTVLPELIAWYEMQRAEDEADAQPTDGGEPIAPDDLVRARLKVTAVKEYFARCRSMKAEDALKSTVADWRRSPRGEEVRIREQLKGGHVRWMTETVTIGAFAVGTLRSWAAIYKKDRRIVAQVPRRKGKCGRRRTEIPDDVLEMVLAFSASTARANIARAVEKVRAIMPPERFPEGVSMRTWERRMEEIDPARKLAILGREGNAAFEAKCSPNVERDWNTLRYNELWEIDDLNLDFYAHSAVDPTNLVRPWIYGIRRVSTRQWVAYVQSEVEITHAQVKALLGFAFASEQGGLPERITFERGKVAMSDGLKSLLDDLGVGYGEASVFGGPTWSSAIPDDNQGNPRAKAVFEANNRRLHNIMWDMAGQVGPEERHTAPGNMEAIKRDSVRRLKAKMPTLLPMAHEASSFVWRCMERDNNSLHTGLPMVWDDAAGKMRHMTPNERAAQLVDEEARRMEPSLLPAFYGDGRRVEVAKNGIQIGRDKKDDSPIWYGRFDEELERYVGRKVTCYVHEDFPELCHVAELGRCLERYHKEAPRGHEQFGQKRHIDKRVRNKFEKLMADTAGREGVFIVEQSRILGNPTPERRMRIEAAPAVAERIDAIQRAAAERTQRDQAITDRFDELRGRTFERAEQDQGAQEPEGRESRSARRRGSRGRSIIDEPTSGLRFSAPVFAGTEDAQ